MPNNKRQGKNEKYGMGGKKRGQKRNTFESTNENDGFSHKKMKSSSFGGGAGGKKTAGGGGPKRPGKSVRQKTRNK